MQLEERVHLHYNDLNESDLHIWHYIKDHKEKCSKMTIEELGKVCNVSRTTILRFSKKLGFEGFTEFKYHLKKEKSFDNCMDSNLVDVDAMFDNHIRILEDLKSRNYDKHCEMIYNASRVFIVSTGKIQRSVAKELARQFFKYGIVMNVVNGDSEVDMLHKMLKPNDLLIIISLKGESKLAVDIAKAVKLAKGHSISITQFDVSSLSRLVDEPIYIYSGSFPIAVGGIYTSVTIFFAMTELLSVSYYNYLLTHGTQEEQRELLEMLG